VSTNLLSERLARSIWEHHANPWTGWTRLFAFPVLVYAIFTRRRGLVVASVAAIAINPVVFPRGEDPQTWTSDLIEAERYWVEHGQRGTVLRLLDAANLPVTAVALYAAYRRKPKSATVFTALSMALKLAFVSALVSNYEAEIEATDEPTARVEIDIDAPADRD